MRKAIIIISILISQYTFADCYCLYVNAINGLNLRESPSFDSKVLKKLPFGTRIVGTKWKQHSNWKSKPVISIIDNGKEVKGYWVRVGKQLKENGEYINGYVFDAYLSEHLNEIPKSSLYLYKRLMIIDSSKKIFNIEYIPEYDNSAWSNSVCQKHFSCCAPINDCEARYEKEPYIPYSFINNKQDSIDTKSSKLDTLKHYIKIEKINVNNYKRLKSKFEIDTVFQPKIIKESYLIKHFYLKIKKGQDSICIRDTEGEGYTSHNYIGEIKALNKYLIKECYESCSVYTIDKENGEKEYFSGIPYISPNGTYQISCSYNDFQMLDNSLTTTLSIVRKDRKLYSISIDFKSWIPAKGIDNIFWVSENEFIVKVSPVDNYVTSYLDNHKEPLKNYEYLKIKIL
ncbi:MULTISPECIES: SH3 domain-containing protein [Winogradskyella]|uniref:SH3 domain-containing protein n=1 Tax=Winogradskyella TaxID=286104 RepID=UPI0015CE5533|nr:MULTISPECIES: SH3 domain-containing protein [Winogradskyella]QXP78430.1 SH3 domain-containing protein [Winogradskyella sp. HaHa_3_26]